MTEGEKKKKKNEKESERHINTLCVWMGLQRRLRGRLHLEFGYNSFQLERKLKEYGSEERRNCN